MLSALQEVILMNTKNSKNAMAVLSVLRQNSRASLTEISKKTKIPISTIHEMLKRQTVIRQYTCILNYESIGFSTRAKILLKAAKTNKPALIEYLMSHFNVNSLYKVNSGYDLLVEAAFPGIKDMEEFLEALECDFKVRSKQVYYIIDELAKEKFMVCPAENIVQ